MSKSLSVKKPFEKSEQNNPQSESLADHPDERLRDFLQGRFPDRLPLSEVRRRKIWMLKAVSLRKAGRSQY
jgi:hypothetical protein